MKKAILLSLAVASGLYGFDATSGVANKFINYTGTLNAPLKGTNVTVNASNLFSGRNFSLGDDNGICNRFVLYTIGEHGYDNLGGADDFGLLLSDILYAPMWLYRVAYDGDQAKSHCLNMWAGRDLINTSNIHSRRDIGTDALKGDIVSQIHNEGTLNKYFDAKIAMKFGADIHKAVYIPATRRFSGIYGGTHGVLSSSSTNGGDNVNISYMLPAAVTKLDYKHTSTDASKQIPIPNVSLGDTTDESISAGYVNVIKGSVSRQNLHTFNENIHTLRTSGGTGVINTYFKTTNNTSATYFLTQDLDNLPNLLALIQDKSPRDKSFYRSNKNGEDVFAHIYEDYAKNKQFMIDLSAVGMLNSQIFESVFYKSKRGGELGKANFDGTSNELNSIQYARAYQTDVYTMHGDYLNKFVTGFGPKGGDYWDKYTIKLNENDPAQEALYDGGWYAHRYLPASKGEFSGTCGLGAQYGLDYDIYDPITTYIPDSWYQAGKVRDHVYKQYAIDDPDDSRVDIHVRPLYALVQSAGGSYTVNPSLMDTIVTPRGNTVSYELRTVFYPDPTDVESLKPFAYKDFTIGEQADHAEVKPKMSEFKMEHWSTNNLPSKSSNSQTYIVKDAFTGKQKTIKCGWGMHGWEDAAVFVCDQPWVITHNKIKNSTNRTYKTNIEALKSDKGIDVLKFKSGDKDTPLRLDPFVNGKSQDLRADATIVSIYRGGLARNFETGEKDQFSEFKWGFSRWDSNGNALTQDKSGADVGHVSGNAAPGGMQRGWRNDAGIRVESRDARANALLDAMDSARIIFTVKKKDDTYIGNIKLDAPEFIRLLEQDIQQHPKDGTTFNFKIKNIYDPDTGRVVPFGAQFRIVVTNEIPDKVSLKIVSRKNKNDIADHIYMQVAGIAQQKENIIDDTGGHFALLKTATKDADDTRATMVKVILQKQQPSGHWEDLGVMVHHNHCSYNTCYKDPGNGGKVHYNDCDFMKQKAFCYYNGKRPFKFKDGTSSADMELVTGALSKYNIFEPQDKQIDFTLAPVNMIISNVNTKADGWFYPKNIGRINYYNEAKRQKANTTGVFRFKIIKITQSQVEQCIREQNITIDRNKGAFTKDGVVVGGDVINQAFDAYTTENFSEDFVIRPAYAKVVSINNADASIKGNVKMSANTFHDNTNVKFELFSAQNNNTGVNYRPDKVAIGNALKINDLKGLDLKLLSAGLMFSSKGSGIGRSYIIAQKANQNAPTINPNHPIIMGKSVASSEQAASTTNAIATSDLAIKFPYKGDEVAIYGAVYAGANKYLDKACDDKAHANGANIAIDGKYSCYAEVIPGYIDFTASLHRQCLPKNQYAFMRDIQDGDPLRFDDSGMYNVSFDCVQKYTDEQGNAIYSVGTPGCSDNDCDTELTTIKRDKDWIKLNDKNYNQDDYSIYARDTNYTGIINAEQKARAFCQHYLDNPYESRANKQRQFDECYKNDIKSREQGAKLGQYEYNYLNTSSDFVSNAAQMNSRFWLAIDKDLGVLQSDAKGNDKLKDSSYKANVTNTYGIPYNHTNSLYLAKLDDIKPNQEYNNELEVTNIGNTFALSIAKARKKGEPVYVEEKLSDDPNEVREDNASKGVIKYGILEVNDIVLDKPIVDKNVLSRAQTKATYPVSVYDDGRFVSLLDDADFGAYKHATSYTELKDQIAGATDFSVVQPERGYFITDTKIVDVVYDIGADDEHIGYKLRSKDINLSSSSFEDIGLIKIQKSDIYHMLRPNTNIIKIIYKDNGNKAWHGVGH